MESAYLAVFNDRFDPHDRWSFAAHELVLLLCFDGGMRLFAAGDGDQSIYGFTGANPELL